MTVQAKLASAVTIAGAFLMTVANATNGTDPTLRGLSNGEAGGIGVGAAVGGAILVGGIYCCCRMFCGRGVAAASAAGATAGLLANAAPA